MRAASVFLLVAAAVAICAPTAAAGSFECTKHSDKPGYRCTRFEVTNYLSSALTLKSSSLDHGEWAQTPPNSIQPDQTGAWESNSDCPLLDCFYGTAPTVVLDVDGSDVTFYGENNLDKLLYGCNKETITPVPSPVEVKVEGENFSGCYCCHTAPCDCSSFQNANAYEVLVSVAPVASISSLSPSVGPSAGTPVTITGKDFVNTSGLACKFGSQVVSAAFVSATQIMCSAPATLAPGVTHVPVSVTNLGSKWSTASTFSYDATNPGAKLYVGSGLLNSVKNALLPVLESMLTNMKVDYFAGSDSVMGITVDYNLTNIVLDSIDFGDVSISTSSAGITLSTSGMEVVTAMDWYYKDSGTIIHGSGSAVDKVSLDMTASFDVVRQGPAGGGDGVPQISDVAVSASITDLDISTEPKSAEILIWLLKNPLKSGFQSMLQKKLYTALSTTLNQALANVTMKIPIGNTMVVDFGLLFDPTFTSDGMELYLRAGAFPPAGVSAVPIAAPAMPSPASATQSVQGLVSDYLANTAMWTLYKAKVLSGVVTPTMLPSSVPLKLNTTFFKTFLPSLYNAFPNRAFDLVINATDAPVMAISDDLPKGEGTGLTVNATLNVTFLITCPSAPSACLPQPAFTLGLGAYTALTAHVASGYVMANSSEPAINVTGHMLDLEFNVSLASSNIGNFSMANLDMLVDMMLRAVALDMINTKLQAGFLVPSQFGSLVFSNTTVAFSHSYVDIQSDANLDTAAPVAVASRASTPLRNSRGALIH